jgi:hypothetical protein
VIRGQATDDEWAFFEPFVTESGPRRGRPPRDHRRTLDAIFWIVRTGAPWRDLPEKLAVVDYFAGLDVPLEETAICIVDGTGIVREARVASEPETLVGFFSTTGLVIQRVGLEACSLTAWLHQGLTEAGISAICIEARQAKAALGAMPNKTDGNDARGIAQIMRTEWYRAVHVKNSSCRH